MTKEELLKALEPYHNNAKIWIYDVDYDTCSKILRVSDSTNSNEDQDLHDQVKYLNDRILELDGRSGEIFTGNGDIYIIAS